MTPANRRPAAKRKKPQPRSNGLVIAVVAGLVAAAAVVAIFATSGSDSDPAPADEARPATVDGAALAPFDPEGEDAAVGQPLPRLEGQALDGSSIVVPEGRPALVLFVAHWCPVCQREVPVVEEWFAGGGLPDSVDLVTVSTAVDSSRPNYPPSEWLEEENWTENVLLDPTNAAAEAVGLTAFPYWVAVDESGAVVARATGELSTEQIDQLVGLIA